MHGARNISDRKVTEENKRKKGGKRKGNNRNGKRKGKGVKRGKEDGMEMETGMEARMRRARETRALREQCNMYHAGQPQERSAQRDSRAVETETKGREHRRANGGGNEKECGYVSNIYITIGNRTLSEQGPSLIGHGGTGRTRRERV